MGRDEKPSWLRGPDAWLAERGNEHHSTSREPTGDPDPADARRRQQARNVVYAARKHASLLHDVVVTMAILACIGSVIFMTESLVVGVASLVSTIAWWALASAVVHILRLLATIAEK